MTAFKNLLLFSNRIAPELALEFIDLVQAYANEEHDATIALLNDIKEVKRPYEVVAIAGTAEQLLNDIINVGDTVECIRASYPTNHSGLRIVKKGKRLVVDIVFSSTLVFSGYDNYYPAKNFRKVSTPIINPLNSVEGC